MSTFDLYRLRIKARLQTAILLRRYRVWSLDGIR